MSKEILIKNESFEEAISNLSRIKSDAEKSRSILSNITSNTENTWIGNSGQVFRMLNLESIKDIKSMEKDLFNIITDLQYTLKEFMNVDEEISLKSRLNTNKK